MKAKLIPACGKILVTRQKADTKSPGGILIPDSAQKKSRLAEVLAVGPGRPTALANAWSEEPGHVKVGQVVVISDYAGSQIEFDGEEYVIIDQNDVQAMVG